MLTTTRFPQSRHVQLHTKTGRASRESVPSSFGCPDVRKVFGGASVDGWFCFSGAHFGDGGCFDRQAVHDFDVRGDDRLTERKAASNLSNSPSASDSQLTNPVRPTVAYAFRKQLQRIPKHQRISCQNYMMDNARPL